jgi:putative ABC transport system permease protein
LTSAQVSAARGAAAQVGLTVEARDSQDGLAALRDVSTGVGALLALAIVAMTIGLLRSESARDLRTLTATGASARTRRALTASTAGALALLGVVLSTLGAYTALVAAYHAQLDRLVPVPTTHLLLLGVGLPAVAAMGGWLLAGREPTAFSRQTLD